MKEVVEMLRAFPPNDLAQQHIKAAFIGFLEANPDAFLRSNLMGHVTASAFVVDRKAEKMLLIHHKKLNRWLQPGGHCDGNTDTLHVAIQEVFEETGICIEKAQQIPMDLDIHLIPARKDVPEHKHYDVRYVFEARCDAPLVANHETLAMRWIPFEEVHLYTNEESILRVLAKLSQKNNTTSLS